MLSQVALLLVIVGGEEVGHREVVVLRKLLKEVSDLGGFDVESAGFFAAGLLLFRPLRCLSGLHWHWDVFLLVQSLFFL